MAVHQKLSEIGWFYHAPKRYVAAEPVLAPPPSQIPGLSDVSGLAPDEAPPRSLFRDTDTKYVRLAKMGGRQGLLHMKEFVPKSKEPQPYQRNNWFYLEDNAAEDAAKKIGDEAWVFRLPEYMVHDEYKPSWTAADGAVGAPGRRAHVRSAEHAAAAAGHAQGAASGGTEAASLHRADHYERAKKLQEEALRSKYTVPPPLFDPKERPMMNKLLSYGYANDWKKVRDEWYVAEQSQKNANEKRQAEVQGADGERAADEHKQKQAAQKRGARLLKLRNPKQEEEADVANANKEPFKLSKFTNIKAKVSTHRNDAELPAAAS